MTGCIFKHNELASVSTEPLRNVGKMLLVRLFLALKCFTHLKPPTMHLHTSFILHSRWWPRIIGTLPRYLAKRVMNQSCIFQWPCLALYIFTIIASIAAVGILLFGFAESIIQWRTSWINAKRGLSRVVGNLIKLASVKF